MDIVRAVPLVAWGSAVVCNLLMTRLTHIGDDGAARMVDVSDKAVTARTARAQAILAMRPETLAEIRSGNVPKGDVFAAARIAGIQGAKRTSDLIPLCHPLPLSTVTVDFEVVGEDKLRIDVRCKVSAKTGVEMEALTAASIASLTVYDMCKSMDRGMRIESVELIAKDGGASGAWRR